MFSCDEDRKKSRDWLHKLQDMENTISEAAVRHDYLTYLLYNIQKGRLTSPFNQSPPAEQLRPLARVLVKIVRTHFASCNNGNSELIFSPFSQITSTKIQSEFWKKRILGWDKIQLIHPIQFLFWELTLLIFRHGFLNLSEALLLFVLRLAMSRTLESDTFFFLILLAIFQTVLFFIGCNLRQAVIQMNKYD